MENMGGYENYEFIDRRELDLVSLYLVDHAKSGVRMFHRQGTQRRQESAQNGVEKSGFADLIEIIWQSFTEFGFDC